MATKFSNEEAQQVERNKPLPKLEDNYLIIVIDYSNRIVLPYTSGMQLIESFKQAEEYDAVSSINSSSDELYYVIKPLNKEFSFRIINYETYKELKMNQLLGCG